MNDDDDDVTTTKCRHPVFCPLQYSSQCHMELHGFTLLVSTWDCFMRWDIALKFCRTRPPQLLLHCVIVNVLSCVWQLLLDEYWLTDWLHWYVEMQIHQRVQASVGELSCFHVGGEELLAKMTHSQCVWKWCMNVCVCVRACEVSHYAGSRTAVRRNDCQYSQEPHVHHRQRDRQVWNQVQPQRHADWHGRVCGGPLRFNNQGWQEKVSNENVMMDKQL